LTNLETDLKQNNLALESISKLENKIMSESYTTSIVRFDNLNNDKLDSNSKLDHILDSGSKIYPNINASLDVHNRELISNLMKTNNDD